MFPYSSQFGESQGPVFLQGLSCGGGDANLLQCADNPIGVHMCEHSMDTGVKCIGKLVVTQRWLDMSAS